MAPIAVGRSTPMRLAEAAYSASSHAAGVSLPSLAHDRADPAAAAQGRPRDEAGLVQRSTPR
jgi:hypothetical protein